MKVIDRGRYSTNPVVFIERSNVFRGELELRLVKRNRWTAYLKPNEARLLGYTLLAEAERLDYEAQKSN